MPRVQTITTNFTAGEFSPRLRGRIDLEKYNASAELLENCVVLRQGGVTARPSRDYCGEIKTSADTGRLIPFVYSRIDAYLLEFGDQRMRVWKAGVLVESSPGVPYELVTPWTDAQLAEVDFTQGGDTLIMTHPDVPPQRLQRFGDASWRVEAVPFDPGALGETGDRHDTITMTISSGAVGTGRTVTASSSFFLPGDVGRVISWGTGRATITAQAGTSATADVTSAFAGTSAAAGVWVVEASPLIAVIPSVDKPIGAAISLSSATNGWRSSHVGKYVEINGGLVKVTSYFSAMQVDGIIVRELAGTTTAPPDSWVVKGQVWNAADGYPASCTLYQQRLWLAGTAKYPQTLWGSKSGAFFDFTPGTDDDSAVYKTIDSDDTNIVQFLASMGSLVALTYGSEFEIKGGVEKPVAPLNAQINMRSRWGCERVRPEQAGRDLMFIQRGGRALRALLTDEVNGFITRDVSVFSEHLFAAGVVSMAWEQVPEQVLWLATGDGDLLAVTYSDEQATVAFCSGNATGAVEWLATIPDGDRDATYALVRYAIDGTTKRYVERLNWEVFPGMDARKEQTSVTPTAVWGGLGHLEGQTVTLLADDVYVGTAVVITGAVTLPRVASKLAAGLPYTIKARLQAPEVGTGTGTSQSQAQSTSTVWVRFLGTIGCKVNGQPLEFRQLDAPILDNPLAAFSGVKQVSSLGWASGESPIELVQDQPYPWTVLAVVRNFTVNAG